MAKPMSVLILDDDKDLLVSMASLFSTEPYGVFTTNHPFEALGVLSRETIKVVLCDQRMPMVSGANFLQEVKANFPNIIRILFTGHADMRSAEDAVNKGQLFAFFSKPCDPDMLLATVRKGIEAYDKAAEERKLLASLRMEREALLSQITEARRILGQLVAGKEGPLSPEQLRLAGEVSDRIEKILQSIERV